MNLDDVFTGAKVSVPFSILAHADHLGWQAQGFRCLRPIFLGSRSTVETSTKKVAETWVNDGKRSFTHFQLSCFVVRAVCAYRIALVVAQCRFCQGDPAKRSCRETSSRDLAQRFGTGTFQEDLAKRSPSETWYGDLFKSLNRNLV